MANIIAFPERDRHVRRSGTDYIEPLVSLLPQGLAWSREPDSVLMRVVKGLADIWGFVDGRAADLLERESDPRKTIELLPEWERAWGLPDPCFPKATTIGERQRMLVMIMTWLGSQSRAYFKKVAEWVGYTIEIKEFAPFMCGISQVGDTRMPPPNSPIEKQNFRWYIGPAEQRFYWEVNVGQIGLTWFRSASGQAGVDPHLRLNVPQELICLLERWKPAHTFIVPDFSALAFGGPMQGTP
jgi:uncharacterized protein YmfQ (DUF2313 family)